MFLLHKFLRDGGYMSKVTSSLRLAQAKVDRLTKDLGSAKMAVQAAKAAIASEKSAEKAAKSLRK